jgi:hypothetical protein
VSRRDHRIDRGRDDYIKVAPPYEPDRRFSRIRLSRSWGLTLRLRVSNFHQSHRRYLLFTHCSSCGQIEQPGFVEEAVGPPAMIESAFGLTLSFDSFA